MPPAALCKAAEQGDEVAQTILREEADELALAAEAVAKLFGADRDFEIVVGGGNLRKSAYYFALFRAAVEQRLPYANVIHPRREPVEGYSLRLRTTKEA